ALADIGAAKRARGQVDVGRAHDACAVAGFRGVAASRRCTAHGAVAAEGSCRTRIGDAVAYLGRITAAARSPADRRALRIGRTNAVTARAELRRIADTGGRSAHGSGRQDRVGRTEERSVAGTVLLDVARAGGRTADERRILERIGGTARAGSVAPFGRVAGVIGAGDAGRELELRLVGLDDDRVRTASLGKQKDLVRGGAVDVGRAI